MLGELSITGCGDKEIGGGRSREKERTGGDPRTPRNRVGVNKESRANGDVGGKLRNGNRGDDSPRAEQPGQG